MRTHTMARAGGIAAILLLVPAAGAAAGPLDLLPPAATEPRPAAKADGPPPPAAIPVPQVVPAAVEAYRSLAAIRARADADGALDEMLAPLEAVAATVEKAGEQLTRQPMAQVSDRDLVDFRQEMLRQDALLARWSAKLESAVKSTYASQRELQRMAEVWKLTEAQVRDEGAGDALVERAGQVRREVEDLQKQVRLRLERLLSAQERVGSLRIRIMGWLSAADRADVQREQQLFEIEARPIWAVLSRKEPVRDFGEQLSRIAQHNASALSAFFREEGTGLFWVLAVFVVVVGAVAWTSRRFAARAAVDPELSAPAEVLAHPVSAGMLVALSLTSWLLPRAPAAFTELVMLVMLAPFLVMVRNLLAPELRTPLYGFTALYAVARVAALVPEYSLPGRLLMLLVAVVGLWGAAVLLRKDARWPAAVKRPSRRARTRFAVWVLGGLVGAGLVANAVGNVGLGRLLVDGALSVAMIALLLAAVARVLAALVAGTLRMPEVRRAFPDPADAARLAERAAGFIDLLGLTFWFLGALRAFRVHQPVKKAVTDVLTARLKFGGIDVSLGDLVAFAVTLWLAVIVARLLRIVLEARLDRQGKLPAGVAVAIAKTVAYTVVALGFLTAVLASGMDVTRFTVILGTLSVGIGFGLQNVVNNFVSGLILLYERPIRVGDVIDVGTAMGTVSHIGIRSSTIATFQGAEVVLPNSLLVSNQLTNWTLSNRIRRVEIDVGVAYGSDVARVQELLLAAARSNSAVRADPPPAALFTGLGDSALSFQLRFWTDQFDRYLAIASEVRAAVVARLGAEGISIPFPQRDLRLVSVDEQVVRAIQSPPPAAKDPAAK
ncbi:MAG TPA: mechanosensitive ion channel domain-containing protein [Anaeromyxobacteraceae bacterium]|nr:mechanosensitive ion channel domain-containing protein [Anaeromyxobacteraceae bacterium]